MTETRGKSQQVRSELSYSHGSVLGQIVGRQRELALVMNYYERAREEHTCIVMVTGEPGIGKTCLLGEAAQRALEDGAVVLRGNASEAEGMPPFLPFLEALGWYIRMTPDDQLRIQLATVPQVLMNLLPELTSYLQTSLPVPPEQIRLRLYEAIGIFLEAISLTRPLVLIFDDLHWADSASLDLLCYLTHRRSHARLLFLGSYREGEAECNVPLMRALTELSHQRLLVSFTLGPLSLQELALLVTRKYDSSLSPEVSDLLHSQSEGNPFFAEELFAGWIDSGILVLKGLQWIAIASLRLVLPPTIVSALRQRFARLDPVVIDHLRVAAIIGRSFDLTLLATVEEQEIELVEESLLAAVQARLIRQEAQGTFFFLHDKIRECLSIEVSSSRRRRLHERIGHELEGAYGQDMGMYHVADLAFHFAQSSDRERGIYYLLLAARQAMQTAAFEEAITHYRTIVALLEVDDRRRGTILLEMGKAALLAGKEYEAEQFYEAAQCVLLQMKEPRVLIGRAIYGLGVALWRQEKLQEASMALERALVLFENDQSTERVYVLIDLAHLLIIYMERQDKGIIFARQALGIAHALGEAVFKTIARRIVVGNLLLQGSDLRRAVQVLEQALVQTQQEDDLVEVGECCLNLSVAYYWMTRINQSYEISRQCIALAERSPQSYQLRTAYIWPVLLYASQGKWGEAERQIAQARSIVKPLEGSRLYVFLCQLQGFLAYQQEKYAIAEQELEAVQELVGQSLRSGLGDMTFYLSLLCVLQVTLGECEKAAVSSAHLKRLLELLPDGILPTAPMKMCLALMAMACGDIEYASSFYTSLLAFRGQYYWFLVDRILGLLATLNGEWNVAALHLAEAETIAQREGLQPELARTLLGQVDVVLGRGDQNSAAEARHLLERACILFEELQMVDSVRRTRQRLQEFSAAQSMWTIAPPLLPQRTSASLPCHLTVREVEVLKLVVSGKSNSRIAQDLVISEKTVINHLTHIFNKTNCENRAAATAFAIRHGLA